MSVKIQRIIKRVKDGDKAAASQLIEIYSNKIYSYLRRLCGNNEDAEDLTQQTFIKVWLSISTYHGYSGFSAWIYKIAYNLFIDWLRRKSFDLNQTDYWWDNCVDDDSIPFEKAADRQMAGRIYKAVDGLDNDKKHVIHLHYYQGLSINETAKVLGIASSTVKYRMREALKFIRSKLNNKEFDYVDTNIFYTEKGDLS